MDFGNYIYTNEQNCILFICKCDIKNFSAQNFLAPPPNPKAVPTALLYLHDINQHCCRLL